VLPAAAPPPVRALAAVALTLVAVAAAASDTAPAALFSRALAWCRPPLNPADTLPVKLCTGTCTAAAAEAQQQWRHDSSDGCVTQTSRSKTEGCVVPDAVLSPLPLALCRNAGRQHAADQEALTAVLYR
jgi:hypothetical protein